MSIYLGKFRFYPCRAYQLNPAVACPKEMKKQPIHQLRSWPQNISISDHLQLVRWPKQWILLQLKEDIER